MPDQTVPIVFVDTETDGVHPGRQPWEIAIIRRESDGTETRWETFLSIDLSTSDPFGLRVGGFYDRHPGGRKLAGLDEPGGRPDDEAVAWTVAKMTHGAHWVGAVPNFDTEVCDRLLRAHALAPAWHYHLVDVENLAVGFLAGQGKPIQPPWKSDDLAELLGLDPVPESERHTALGDARFAQRIYDRVMGGDQRTDADRVADTRREAAQAIERAVRTGDGA